MGKAGVALADRDEVASGPSDHELVSAVRGGDDRAFELLYGRYQRRIAGYVYGMVKDHGRAEDITQEVFVSALRRMRQTERPIAFKPWIFEIAKNACIDAYRRARRAQEVSFDTDERMSAADHGKLVDAAPEPDAAVDAKQELTHLCGAFGGLSETHHRILVLRELEGRSYKDIGDRMGMSRPAVESTLFRARKRLGEEYDDLASGARCLRIEAIVEQADEARLGVRDARRLARHVSHCQPCRRLALRAGLDVPGRRGVAGKIAAWLPLPAFLRLRRGGGEEAASSAAANGGGWKAHVPALAEQLHTGWGKAAAGLAAAVVAGAGVGAGTGALDGLRDEGGRGPAPTSAPAGPGAGGPGASSAGATGAGATVRGMAAARGTAAGGSAAGTKRDERRLKPGAAGGGKPVAGAGSAPAPERGASGGDITDQVPRVDAQSPKLPTVPKVPKAPKVPGVGGAPLPGGGTVDETVQDVQDTVGGAQDTVGDAVQGVPYVPTTPPVPAPGAGGAVDDAVNGAGGLVPTP